MSATPSTRPSRRAGRALPALALAIAAGLALLPAGASAAGSSYDAVGKTLTVSMTTYGETATLARNAAGAITVDGAPASTATTTNTDTVRVVGNGLAQNLIIDLVAPLGPGATAEGTGTSEIEIVAALAGGHDTVRVVGTGAGDRITFGSGGANLNGDDDADLRLSGINQHEVRANAGDDIISADGGAGTGSALTRPVYVFGGAGNDTLTGGESYDELYGDADVAATTATAGGNDTFNGGDGADRLHGHGGNDTLNGEDAGDYIYAGLGNDVVSGGAGTDFLENSSSGTAGADGADVYRGGSGEDRLYLNKRTGNTRVTLDNLANDGLDADANGVAEEGDDIRHDVDSIELGSGNDFVDADVPPANAANVSNSISGGLGNDELRGGENVDRLNGQGGNDTLRGGEDNDVITGDDGVDTMLGGNGADTFTPGLGNDVVNGERGMDTIYVATTPDGADAITGGAGTDDVSYYGRASNTLITLDNVANDGADANADGTAEEGDNVAADVEKLSTGGGNDRVDADTAQANALATVNTIRTNAGTDTVRGGAGDDDIATGDGNDSLNGGLGEDLLDGGNGADAFSAQDGDFDRLLGGTGDGVADTGTWDAGLDELTTIP